MRTDPEFAVGPEGKSGPEVRVYPKLLHLFCLDSDTHSSGDTPDRENNALPVSEPAPVPPTTKVVDPSAPPTVQQNIPAQSEQASSHAEKQQEPTPLPVPAAKAGTLTPFEKITVRFGVAGAVIGVLTLIAAGVAGWSAFQQFNEMAAQTEFLSRSAQQSRQGSMESTIATQKQISALQGQVKASQDAAAIASRQLDATVKQFQQDERAWVGVRNLNFTINSQDPFRLETQVSILGKTPATNITVQMGIRHLPSDHALVRNDLVLDKEIASQGTGFPDSFFPIRELTRTPHPDRVALITSKQLVIYFFGEIVYKDVFSIRHWTHFCYVISSLDVTVDGLCPIYNDSDADAKTQTKNPT